MLSLEKIIITHFKNYSLQSFEFGNAVVGICGNNGKGKTNLLDAIYYSCFTKSYFPGSDTLNIHFNQEGFRIESRFVLEKTSYQVICIQRNQAKKECYLNNVQYDKLSKHIGLLPAVMIAPDDIDLINGGSELRRKFVDTLLSQLDDHYLKSLINYNKIIQQRNSLLKMGADNKHLDYSLLDILDQQLLVPTHYIHSKRTFYINKLITLVKEHYQEIAQNEEELYITYESQLNNESFEQLLKYNREKDRILQRTNAGIHKDDLKFEWNQLGFKNIASQGQKKSLLFALKLAEFDLLKENKGFSPILLLDDVFEKLDQRRMNNLLEWVCCKNKAQVFITDPHQQRLQDSFNMLGLKGQIIAL